MGLWMVFGSLLWLVFWGTFFYLFVSFVRPPRSMQQDTREEPIDLARRRYGSGQITARSTSGSATTSPRELDARSAPGRSSSVSLPSQQGRQRSSRSHQRLRRAPA
jgi:hypothetical protein